MEREHAAFFGNEPKENASQLGEPVGIPADLLPYLEAADLPDDEGEEGSETDVRLVDEGEDLSERDAALHALAMNAMLVGPDPEILAEIDGDYTNYGEEWEEDLRASRDEESHEVHLDEAERTVALDAEVQRIYDLIVARVPEHQIQPSLERVRAVLDILGDPQNSYPSIHLTGTNGKTSTTRIIDSLLRACGVRTGRFTSPHLVDVRERICLDGEKISREGFIGAWNDIAPYVQMVDEAQIASGGVRMSFFELFTVMAFAAFADYPVDAAVVEVGMGGRWDATNLMDSGVAVITPIDLDHTKWLGSSIREIATEKAGIIKPGQIVVISEQPEEALEVLLERAREVDAIVRLEGRDFEVLSRTMGVGGQMVTVRTPAAIYEDIFLPLFGEYQAHNAAAALVAVEAFMGGRELEGVLVEKGMMEVSSPGRLHVVRHSPTIIVDAAHNPAGARTLGDALSESFDFRHVVGVYSAMGDKDIETVLSEVEPHLEQLIVTQMPGNRAMPVEDLEEIALDVFGEGRVEAHEDLLQAISRAVELAEASEDPSNRAGIVIFGSVLLAGEVLKNLGIHA